MERNLQNRVITAVNTYFPVLVDDYLTDYKDSIEQAIQNNQIPKALLDLVITLKHWANPFSDYSLKLSAAEVINFKDIEDVLASPKKILSQDPNITPEDEKEIAELVRIKLDKMADELIQKYNLKAEIEKQISFDKNAVEKWWEKKTEREKLRIQQDFMNLSVHEKERLEKKVNQYYVTYVNYPDPALSNYYWMCHCRSDLYFYNWITMLQVADIFSHMHGGHMHPGCIDCNMHPGGGADEAKALGIVAAVVAGVSLASAGLVGGIYAAKKTLNSIGNFFTGNKMLRSLYRLAGIAGGAYLGFVEGTVIGATLGSMVPGVGNVAGAMIGMAFGAGLGAGLGALVTKYTAKGISVLFHLKAINPTNPEKYKLTKKQTKNLRNKKHDLVTIDIMLRAIKREKDKIGVSGSFPWTEARAKKNALNALLKKVKNAQIEGPTRIGALYYDPKLSRFESETKAANDGTSSTARYILPGLNDVKTVETATIPPYTGTQPSAPPYEDSKTSTDAPIPYTPTNNISYPNLDADLVEMNTKRCANR